MSGLHVARRESVFWHVHFGGTCVDWIDLLVQTSIQLSVNILLNAFVPPALYASPPLLRP